MRLPLPAVIAAALVAAAGVTGLVRGAVPIGDSAAAAAPIVVSGAWVREPAPPTDAAAAYFTVTNTTGRPDRLVSVTSGAGEQASLHTTENGRMSELAAGAVIPAHGRLVLSTGGDHVMIEKLIGTLRPGQNVNLQLTFARAGVISVSAPVVALGAPVPTAAPGVPGTEAPGANAPGAGAQHQHGGDR